MTVRNEQESPGRAGATIGRWAIGMRPVLELAIGTGRVGLPLANRGLDGVWPSEMDLPARIAGLRLKERWGGWKGEPFTSESEGHVSVYGREDSTNGERE